MDNIIFIILLSGGILAVAIFAGTLILKIYRQKRYGRLSSFVLLEHSVGRVYKRLSGNAVFRQINDEIAYKISVFNTLSFEKNSYYALLLLFVLSFLLTVISIVVIRFFWPLWYIAFVYIAASCAVALFSVQMIFDLIMNGYLKKMPEALKILQSRFLSKGSLTKAIQASIPDFPKGIRSEMIRIYDALKLNETERIREIFLKIDRKYANEHMSVLLELIWLAHYNGGDEAIKMQFDSIVKDVIEDLENQQDLRGAALSYMIMSLLFVAAIPIVRLYNGTILDSTAMQYYETRGSMLLAAGYVGFLILLAALLIYLQKKG